MGRMIEQIALQRGHEIVSIIDINNLEDFDSPQFASADVAIEFTSPKAAYDNYLRAFAHNVKVVSGSTGWMDEHADDVRRMCNEEGKTLFWASNFSIGVAIFSAVMPSTTLFCCYRNPAGSAIFDTYNEGRDNLYL